jgi:hypothetical protein
LGLVIALGIFYFIATMPISGDWMPPGAYSVGYNATASNCIDHPEFCKYPLNLTVDLNVSH